MSDDNIHMIKQSKRSALDWTIEESLRSLLKECTEETFPYTKMLVCLVDDTDDKYIAGYRMAGLRGTEAIPLMEVVKTSMMFDLMGLE